jgi:hypothetical protein
MARQPKSAVKYTPKAMNSDEKCNLCAHFYTVGAYDAQHYLRYLRVGRCTQVEGEINSQGWCELFKRQA